MAAVSAAFPRPRPAGRADPTPTPCWTLLPSPGLRVPLISLLPGDRSSGRAFTSRSLERVTRPSENKTRTLALLTNDFDLEWVLSQVGRADSKGTLDVYPRLEQRAKRDDSKSFERLIR